MAHIGLISCASKKLSKLAKAKDLYSSPLFAKSRTFVEDNCDSWYILSAKYGLISPEETIKPYDDTLKNKTHKERKAWAGLVWSKLDNILKPSDTVTVLAGEYYREFIVPLMVEKGCHVEIPMKGLGIGRQLQWLSNHIAHSNLKQDVNRFYDLLHLLENGVGGKRNLALCSAKQEWPSSGIYIFFEPGEYRSEGERHRVVRVGTHGVSRGSKATLWNRLRTHRGTATGAGNHRSSIFRLHVGAAISAKNPSLMIESWGVGQTANQKVREAEATLEKMVSTHIGAMSILWLAIEDKAGPGSDRAYLERNIIGMLAGNGEPVDAPSKNWLGLYSPSQQIKDSGLWNLDFLQYGYSPEFLSILEEYVLVTIEEKPKPSGPIAPSNWYTKERQGVSRNQLALFKE